MDDGTRYRILKILHNNPDINQRELAQHLGISLGKVNYCLKALMEKGWVKVQELKKSENKKRIAYFLTPQGLKEKSRVTWRFLKIKQAEYEVMMSELQELRNEVAVIKGIDEFD